MEEEQEPRRCGWVILKEAMAEARKKREADKRHAKKKDPIVVSGILANHLLECPQEEFYEWLRTHTDDDDKLD